MDLTARGGRSSRGRKGAMTDSEARAAAAAEPRTGKLGIVLTGGGARGAYQVGVLRGIARQLPDLRLPIITGASAGAINAIYLAAHPGSTREAAEGLAELWEGLEFSDVFRVDGWSLARNAAAWTPDLCGSVPSRRPLSTSHSFALASAPPVISCEPSGENASARTRSRGACRSSRCTVPLAKSKMVTVPFRSPAATHLP